MIAIERCDAVAVLRLVRGKGNSLETGFIRAILAGLDEIEASDARAIVVTGSGGFFSAGVDLVALSRGGRTYLDELLPAIGALIRRALTISKPMVAAIDGHAVAGGCVMVQACDRRIMASGPFTIGLPELLVGVPFPTLAMEVVRAAVDPRWFLEVIYGGATYAPDDALVRGLVDEVVPGDQVLPRAVAAAERLGSIPPRTFALTKRSLRLPLLDRAGRAGAEIDAEILAAWDAPEIRQAVTAYVSRTLGR